MKVESIEDKNVLRQAAVLLESENHKLIKQNLELKRRVHELEGGEPQQLSFYTQELEQQLHVRNHLLFGDSSEKRPTKNQKASKKKKKGHGPRKRPTLPLHEVVHPLDEADKVCPSCGGQLELWKGQSEDSEEIESIARCFIRVKHKRLKYRCRCGGCIETALGPNKLIGGGRYATSIAVGVAVDKYADHLPLERQAKIMTRQGLTIDSQTLWDQIEALGRHLQPAYERLHEYVLTKSVVGADETTWRLLGQKAGAKSKGKKRWFVWALCADDAVFYRIDESRSSKAAAKLIGSFAGTVMCDGYTAYQALQKQGASFRIAHCWAHVRRKYLEAEATAPKPCAEVLDLIGQLYGVEKEVATGPPDQRLALRQTKSKPIVQKIHRWALEQEALPQSPLGKAIGYMGSLWPGLGVFLEDENVTLDNNGVERALRGVVLGRKNHYGSRSRRGTEVAALFYSLTESAKLAGVDPDRYLKEAIRAALDNEIIPLPHEILQDKS